ncbi:MAG: hydantoinase B/oxoprolinase family protein, partial [Candidatus Thorarchaeota archaeon]
MKIYTDIITVSVVQKALESIAQEMAIVLRNTAFSPNIKERRDFSCALFNNLGDIIASKDGIPVHLGSMDLSIKAGLKRFSGEVVEGDVLVHNSPYLGGTHLPDITLYKPVRVQESSDTLFFVASRGHHSDVGGKVPGSMPGFSETLYEEGIQIPPLKLWEKGEINDQLFDLILSNVRTPKERKGDLLAQKGSLDIGERRLKELFEKYSYPKMISILENLAMRTEKAIQDEIEKIPIDQIFSAEDIMDSDGNPNNELSKSIKIKTTIFRSKDSPSKLAIDFTGSSGARKANCNATRGIT